MLDSQFIGLNLHFAVNLLAALVAFAVFWLIFDAWTIRRSRTEMFKWAGFLALSLGFILRATATQAQLGSLSQIVSHSSDILRLLGYVSIVIGQLLDPLQERPKYDIEMPEIVGPEPAATEPPTPVPTPAPPPPPPPPQKATAGTKVQVKAAPAKKHPHRAHSLALIGSWAGLILPLGAFAVGALYWRRATTGLERHLKPVAWGFAALTLFELLNNATSLQGTSNPNLYRLVQTYGPIWWAALITLLAASLILGRWVWRYLTKRLQSQLFIILVGETLALFLFSTIGFTFLLLQNIQNQSLTDLSTASHVLDYAITSRQAETVAQSEAVAANSAVATAITARDHKTLAATLAGYMPSRGLTTLTIVNASGQVLLRGEDPDRWGDSLSSDPLVRRGVIGQASSSVVVHDGVVAPSVTLIAASPIRGADGTIVGVVVTGRAISNAFVDGVRTSTGLDSAVYGGNIRAATTLTSGDSSTRAIGIKETSSAVNTQVLTKNKSYNGVVNFQGRAYLASFAPLHDVNNGPVGMLLVARPKDALYAAANSSIQLTFLFVVALVFLSIYPIYRIARFLSDQLR
jgi:hypothetical protein